MKNHLVRSYSSKETLERVDELAWKLAALAADKVPVEKEVADMVINRVIDNAAVAIAAINRLPIFELPAMPTCPQSIECSPISVL